MKQIAADWISNKATQKICGMLTNAGYDCYFVGGCVRNALLDAPVNDIDIATNALPQQVMDLANAMDLKALPTGIDHGTITVIASGTPFEITTYRRDVETDGRRAVVAFSDNIIDDARRRDFTMNALYADQNGTVTDPLNGMPDLLARRVRFIEDADCRIKEDYLRILRFFRFHAWYGDANAGLDADGLAASAANLSGLETISKERVGSELKKLLSATDPAPSIASMAASGVLNTILSGSDAKALPILVHLEHDIAPDPLRRLAVIGGVDVEDRLRLSKVETRAIHRMRDEIGSTRQPAELSYRFGSDVARNVVLLRAALFEAPLDPDAMTQVKFGQTVTFPIAAADLMPSFQGVALGKQLSELEAKWIKSGFAMTKEQLLA